MALAPETTEPEDGPPADEKRLKQAVVVVHGMGDQEPDKGKKGEGPDALGEYPPSTNGR